MSTPVLAFHNNPVKQQFYLDRVEAHYLADEIAQGAYVNTLQEDHPQYCAVGCVLHEPTGGHGRYPDEIGAPESLAYLQDRIFESRSPADAKEWARNFMRAIPLGADLSNVVPLFMAWLMDDPTYGVGPNTADAEIKELALEVARRYRTGEGLVGEEAEALADRLRAAFVKASADELLRLLRTAPVPVQPVSAA